MAERKYKALTLLVDNDQEEDSPCDGCSLNKPIKGSNCTFVQPRRYDADGTVAAPKDPVEVLIVADAPTPDDNENAGLKANKDRWNFMSDKLGRQVLQAVKDAGFKSFAVIPAVRCYPGGNVDHLVMKKQYKGGAKFDRETPLDRAKKAIPYCSEYVRRAMADLDPKITLTMGPLAAQAVGMGGNVNQLRVTPVHPKPGLAAASPTEGFVATYDRFLAVKSDHAYYSLFKDIEKVKSIFDTGYATPLGNEKTINVKVLNTLAEVGAFVDWALTTKFDHDDMLCFDYEADSKLLSEEHNRLLNVGFCMRKADDDAYVIPLAHPETPFSPDDLEQVYGHLRRLFAGKGASFYGYLAHAAQFEVLFTKLFFDVWLGEEGGKPILDTQVFSHLLDEERKLSIQKPNSLETLGLEFLGFKWYAETRMKQKRTRLSQERLDVVNTYVGFDAVVTARLMNVLMAKAKWEGSLPDMLKVARHVYANAVPYTCDLTLTGQKVSVPLLQRLRAPESTIIQRLREIEKIFQESEEVARAMEIVRGRTAGGVKAPSPFKGNANRIFSLTSPDHRTALFWDVMAIPGADESHDKAWQEKNKSIPLVALFQEYQGLSKLDTSYLEPIAKWLQSPNSPDGRLRPNFNLINTNTGRLSATHPNTQQNVRGDTKDKKQIKSLTTAEDGHVLVQLDFSQAEVRWLGIVSGDVALANKYKTAEEIKERLLKDPTNEQLQRALKVEGDIHMDTALTMYKLSRDLPFTDAKAAKLARQKAKAVCFGLIYGKTVKSLAKDLGISEAECQEAVDLWLGQFPQASEWLDEKERQARENGYVVSPFGRWRRLPEAKADDISVANRAGRQARNTPIQSAASDCCIYAAAKTREAIRQSEDPEVRKVRLINTVHDSLVAEAPASKRAVAGYAKIAKAIFTDPDLLREDFGIEITVPLAVDFDVGLNSGNMTEYDFTEESLERALYDAEVLRRQPPGSLLEDLAKNGLLYDQVVLGRPLD